MVLVGAARPPSPPVSTSPDAKSPLHVISNSSQDSLPSVASTAALPSPQFSPQVGAEAAARSLLSALPSEPVVLPPSPRAIVGPLPPSPKPLKAAIHAPKDLLAAEKNRVHVVEQRQKKLFVSAIGFVALSAFAAFFLSPISLTMLSTFMPGLSILASAPTWIFAVPLGFIGLTIFTSFIVYMNFAEDLERAQADLILAECKKASQPSAAAEAPQPLTFSDQESGRECVGTRMPIHTAMHVERLRAAGYTVWPPSTTPYLNLTRRRLCLERQRKS